MGVGSGAVRPGDEDEHKERSPGCVREGGETDDISCEPRDAEEEGRGINGMRWNE